MRTLGVIDVSCDPQGMGIQRASRLSGRFGSQSLLTWMIRRVTESERLDHVVTVFSKAEARRFHLPELVPSDVDCVVFDLADPLKRMVATLDQYPTDAMVRVGMESPFVDPILIDHLIDATEAGAPVDYASYRLRDGNPAILSHVGLFAEWCSASSLRKVDQLVKSADDRRQLTRYFFSHAEQFRLRLIPVPDAIDREDARLSVDGMEDLELADDIFEALGADGLTCYNLAELVSDHPDMRQRMEALNQATES